MRQWTIDKHGHSDLLLRIELRRKIQDQLEPIFVESVELPYSMMPEGDNDNGGEIEAITDLEESPDFEVKSATETHIAQDISKSSQHELENGESTKDNLMAELEALKTELAATQQQLSEARSQSETKAKQLQDAQDQIFRLQPHRKDITESEARDAYQSLCGNVQRWVENRLKDVLDDLEHGCLGSRPIPSEASRFVGLLREPSRRCLNVYQSDEYHTMAVIMNYLNLVLFSQSFYCPLDDTDGDGTLLWIDGLENTISRLPRGMRSSWFSALFFRLTIPDVAHSREWRSETLTALTHQSTFKSRRLRHLNRVADDLTALLSTVAPRIPFAELQKSVKRSIIEPAAELVHQLHLASSIFSLKWPVRTASARLEVYQCLNLASDGHVLDLSGTNQTSPERQNVNYLFDVAPGLFVERIQGGKKLGVKAIAKPTVLIYSDGEAHQKPTVTEWLWNNTSRSPGSSRSAARTPASTSKQAYTGHPSKL